jgi:hypothetical protein
LFKLFTEILKRAAALIVLKVTGIVAAGSVFGAELWQSAGIAAFVGLVEVAESLAKAYVVDGELNNVEVNEAFRKAGGKK